MSLGFGDRLHAAWHQIYTNGRPNARLTAGLVLIAKLCLYHSKMHNNWRFFDRLRIGSVTNRTGWGLPDPGFVRGPTYVILPVSQRKMEVPATRRAQVIAPGNDHDRDKSKGLVESLQSLLAGKKFSAGIGGVDRRRRVGHGGALPVRGDMARVDFDPDGDPYDPHFAAQG